MNARQKQLEFLMQAGNVERNHTHPGLLPDSVARHSWGVAMFCYILCHRSGMQASYGLLMNALTHDLGELAASDVNGAAKTSLYTQRANDERVYIEEVTCAHFGFDFGNLSDIEGQILFMSDKMEYLTRCVRERTYGNITVTRGYRETRNLIFKIVTDDIKLRERYKHVCLSIVDVMSDIDTMWKEANVGISGEFDVYKDVANALQRYNHAHLSEGETPHQPNTDQSRTEQPK